MAQLLFSSEEAQQLIVGGVMPIAKGGGEHDDEFAVVGRSTKWKRRDVSCFHAPEEGDETNFRDF